MLFGWNILYVDQIWEIFLLFIQKRSVCSRSIARTNKCGTTNSYCIYDFHGFDSFKVCLIIIQRRVNQRPISSLYRYYNNVFMLLTEVRILFPIRIKKEFLMWNREQLVFGVNIILNKLLVMILKCLFRNSPAYQIVPS